MLLVAELRFMSINETLLEEISSYLYRYSLYEEDIEPFLNHRGSFLQRQRKAIQIIENIMTKHKKQKLLRYVIELARVEHGIRELEPWARDHVVHALLSFVLGIYLNEKYLQTLSSILVDPFQWKLAGLFHDIGYPVQIAKDAILRPFAEKINEIRRKLGFEARDVFFKVVPVGLANLTNDINAIDLIQKRLSDWNLQIDAEEEYNRMIKSGSVRHGIISSLAVLYVIDLMYQKYNPKRENRDIHVREGGNVNFNQKYFEGDVVSACSAIYIHDLRNECFADSKIDRSRAPVAFLLKLSDCLQEWERPSLLTPIGFSAVQFAIGIDQNRLVFHADIKKEKKEKMINNISSTLIAPDIEIP